MIPKPGRAAPKVITFDHLPAWPAGQISLDRPRTSPVAGRCGPEEDGGDLERQKTHLLEHAVFYQAETFSLAERNPSFSDVAHSTVIHPTVHEQLP
ncbi:hypothetical protein SCLCIDRAFT_30039 [Scleroderma citrinum Foug A]|uniref:Uncharacterized protein n=1 Tax=Scleroderma citrinum Foug A TaxID=1036808 RepID=A0A0C2Z214_9AGAM|nr:hypothetical protein SCLCIDRAFT_30039 [Scleroderma citrinum Foug A]